MEIVHQIVVNSIVILKTILARIYVHFAMPLFHIAQNVAIAVLVHCAILPILWSKVNILIEK